MEGCASTTLMVALMLAVFYFLVLRPQAKELQERQKFRDSLKVGDRVITFGGLFGKIEDIKGERVTLEVAPRVQVRVQKEKIEARQASTNDSAAREESGGDST